jgi:hypothetical protein
VAIPLLRLVTLAVEVPDAVVEVGKIPVEIEVVLVGKLVVLTLFSALQHTSAVEPAVDVYVGEGHNLDTEELVLAGE